MAETACGEDLPPCGVAVDPRFYAIMFLRVSKRRKDGKEHRYYSVVENRRVRGGKHVQKTVLYLGEINGSQRAAWACGFR